MVKVEGEPAPPPPRPGLGGGPTSGGTGTLSIFFFPRFVNTTKKWCILTNFC